ncbi:hypothetical protein PybrP1_004504 [[Pythium] brassicae (nom. inval.)]|nr:hypothetical protein PybrP1_004504 [[Pythium] brassicae (nom. inval.)]
MLAGGASQAVQLLGGSGLLSSLLRRSGSSSSHPIVFARRNMATAAVDDVYYPRKGHEAGRPRVSKGMLTAIHLVTWYCFSASATFTNKVLIKHHHVSAEMLTLSHLFVSVICDFIVLTFPNSRASATSWRMQSISFKSLLWIMPLSLCSVLAKVLTYWSYDAVPVAIAHTCKASQPFFNVILAYFIYRSKFPLATYLSLVPIVLGVVLASVSEMGMNDLALGGAIFAVTSALIGVMQSIAFLSFAINAPLVVLNASANAVKFPPTDPANQFPYVTVLLCSLMHFVGSFCSSLVLGEVSELTFSIMSTMKRVVIILSAVFYFGNAVTAQSVAGMVLAVGGVGSYQILKLQDRKKDKEVLPR